MLAPVMIVCRSSSSGSKRGDKDRLPSGRSSGSGSKRSLPGSHAGELQAALQAVQKITGAKPPGRSLSLPTTDKKVVSQPDLLDEETVRRRTGTIVEELANNGDFKVGVVYMHTHTHTTHTHTHTAHTHIHTYTHTHCRRLWSV